MRIHEPHLSKQMKRRSLFAFLFSTRNDLQPASTSRAIVTASSGEQLVGIIDVHDSDCDVLSQNENRCLSPVLVGWMVTSSKANAWCRIIKFPSWMTYFCSLMMLACSYFGLLRTVEKVQFGANFLEFQRVQIMLQVHPFELENLYRLCTSK